MPISVCRHCIRYFVTEEAKKHRCPDCRRKLEKASAEEWQQRQSAEKPPQPGVERSRRASGM